MVVCSECTIYAMELLAIGILVELYSKEEIQHTYNYL